MVVLYFTAEWCGPCKMLKPRIQNVSGQLPGVPFAMVDVDTARRGAASFALRKLPTVIVMKRGVEVSRHEGASISEAGLLGLIQPHL
jgi:thioredoxin 1